MISVDLANSSIRELNERLHKLPKDTNERAWRVLNPKGAHAIAAGLTVPIEVVVDGHAGYYCAGMNKEATVIVPEDQLALAAYFAQQKWPNLGQPSAPDNVATKAQSTIGSVGPCTACHLEHFQGDGTTARLAGQWQEYLQATMLAFRDNSRGNNPGMSDLMKATATDDISALSQYLAGLQIDQYLGYGR